MTTTNNETKSVHIDKENERISKMYPREMPDNMESPKFVETGLERIYEISGEEKNMWGRWRGQRGLTNSIKKNTDAIIVGIGDKDVIADVPGFYFIKTTQINKVVEEGRRLGLNLQCKDVTNSYMSFLEKRYEVDQSVFDACAIEGFTSVDEDFYMGGKKVRFRPIETLKTGEWNHYPEELYGYEWCARIIKYATAGDLCVLPSLLPDDGKIYTLWVEIDGDWCVFVPDSSKRKSWRRLPILFNGYAKNITSPWEIDNQSAYYVRQDNWGIGMRSRYCGEIMIIYRHESNPCPLAMQLSHEGFLNELDKKRAIKARDEYYSRLITPRS